MRFRHASLGVLAVLSLALVPARDAAACGGCFPDLAQQGGTQVSGHRMVLSISKTQTTLWDQITYAGDAQSFAWVLPIKGKVDVGISSDALFGNLERLSQVFIAPPEHICPAPPPCNACGPVAPPSDSPATGLGVQVIAQEVVGPYESVQLSSQDPNALKTWLTEHNYTIPDDISPTISAYVAEGFNFLALRLTPGQAIKSMKPVRVTTPGASPVLPLRMVAAGAGAVVPLTLWVLGEGKYVPSNFSSFTVSQDKLIWDWDKHESNYKSVRQEAFAATSNKGWLLEASQKFGKPDLITPLFNLAVSLPEKSGYGDGMSVGPVEACAGDVEAMFPDSNLTGLTVTRLHAELPKEALATDLTLEAASDQEPVSPYIQVTKAVGTPPPCPVYSSSPGLPPAPATPVTPATHDSSAGGCEYTASSGADASLVPFGALLSLGWLIAARRKKADRAILP